MKSNAFMHTNLQWASNFIGQLLFFSFAASHKRCPNNISHLEVHRLWLLQFRRCAQHKCSLGTLEWRYSPDLEEEEGYRLSIYKFRGRRLQPTQSWVCCWMYSPCSHIHEQMEFAILVCDWKDHTFVAVRFWKGKWKPAGHTTHAKYWGRHGMASATHGTVSRHWWGKMLKMQQMETHWSCPSFTGSNRFFYIGTNFTDATRVLLFFAIRHWGIVMSHLWSISDTAKTWGWFTAYANTRTW